MGLNNSKMWGIALLTVLAAAGVATPALAEVKIAVVDYGRLLSESPQAKAALDAIRTEFGPKEREMQQQQAALKAKEDKLQKDGATMTPDQRSRAEKELRDGARDLQRKQQEAQDDLTARRNEEMSRLQKSLIEEVRTYAKAQNFDLVIADGVIYSVPALDITPAILASLQSRAPKPAAGSPAGGSAPKPPAK
jgi:outer membrane protein